MMKGGAIEGGMPLWKRNVNILLTGFVNNIVPGSYLSSSIPGSGLIALTFLGP
jgi:hypothetical protein